MSTEAIAAPDVYRGICQVAKVISRDGISKDKSNAQQGYKFRGIDDIYNALSAVIAGADLCILPRMTERSQEERTTAKGGVLFYVTVRADFDFVSARDGSKHTVTMYGEAMDSADKATNKAMSAAYKYACLQVFCIPTEGMEDADSETHQPTPKTVANSKIAQMKAGASYADARADLAPALEASIEQAEARKPFDKFAMFKAMGVLKEQYVAIGCEEAYRLCLKKHGSETGKRDGLPTNDGGKAARACYKELGALLQSLKAQKEEVNA